MSNRVIRPCVFCGTPTRSIYGACDQHIDLIAEDYRYVRSQLLDGPTASDVRSRAMQAAAETGEDTAPTNGKAA